MKIISTIVLIVIIFNSCKNHNQTSTNINIGNGKALLVDVEKVDDEVIMKSSEIIENIKYIPLQSKEGVVIGEIKKVVSINGLLFIQDKFTQSIYTFDYNGRHISTISRVGQAEGEYINMDAFCVDPTNNNIMIFDGARGNLLTYKLNGKFLSDKKIGATLKGIVKCGDVLFINTEFYWNKPIYNTFPKQSQILMLSENNTEPKRFLEYTYNDWLVQYPRMGDKFVTLNDTVIYIDDVNQKVYSLTSEGHIKERYVIDFNQFNIPFKYSEIKNRSQIEKLSELTHNERIAKITRFLETRNHLCIKYSYKNLIWTCFISKKSGRIVNVPLLIYNKDGIQISSPVSNTDSTFIGYIDAYAFKEACNNSRLPKSSQVKEINASLAVADNPVLLILKMKDDF